MVELSEIEMKERAQEQIEQEEAVVHDTPAKQSAPVIAAGRS